MIKAAKMSLIGSPKRSDRNRKRPRRTRVGSRGLRKAMRHHPARPAYQREPARLPSWCSRSYGAASATWGIDAPAPGITIKRGRAGFTDKRYLARFAGDPRAPGGGAILDLIARVNRRASARVFTLVFGFHCLDHGLSPFMRLVHVQAARWCARQRWARAYRADTIGQHYKRPFGGRNSCSARAAWSRAGQSSGEVELNKQFFRGPYGPKM